MGVGRVFALLMLCACGRYGFGAGFDAPPDVVTDADGTATPRTLFSHANDTCVIRPSGGLRCWGDNTFFQLGLGNNNAIGDDEPASAGDLPLVGTIASVAPGFDHMCALMTTGAVRCWGSGNLGALGYGNTATIGDNETVAGLGDVDLGGTALQIAADNNSCAVMPDHGVKCWGSESLGYGNTVVIGDDEPPSAVGEVDVGDTVREITTGSNHTCVVLERGAVRCWGGAVFGRLGYANATTIGDDETPASAGDVDVGGSVARVVTNAWHTCALMTTGNVRCWGRNDVGQLGYGNTQDVGDNETPASVGDIDVGGPVRDIGVGFFHTCALMMSGAVRCWGDGVQVPLGYGNTNRIGDNETPASVGDVPLGDTATELVVGGRHTCARLTSGGVRCWGIGAQGELGTGSTTAIGDDEPASASPIIPVD